MSRDWAARDVFRRAVTAAGPNISFMEFTPYKYHLFICILTYIY
jgi:hypothetical protein